ncbi:hypothetical protein D9619_008821 [Psilocybe cf. subviscida]|uniref:Uncharacterized protein n=1 Tax=Psilocybe cf. subviscida TaxID=2480587 RepID=A0A8H5F110_9AGAR|nr:hypothetical protein D9619_008821 [Psilocybe cf. subviscida]
MFRGKHNYPDLDILDSPLLSPTAGAPFSTMPPSALADRIFNDPESWGEDDTSDNDFPQDVDDLTWLTEELEKVVQSAGMGHSGAFGVKAGGSDADDQHDAPASSMPRHARASAQRVVGKKGPLRPISLAALLDHDNEDFSGEIQQQLSKILESGGIPHHVRPLPRSSVLSPPSTSSSESSPTTPLHVHTGFSNLQRGDVSPSPINIYSASATLSFLEWYGIYPDTPRNGRRSFLQPKSALSQRTPILQAPSPRYAPRPPSLRKAAPISSEARLGNAPQQPRANSVPPVAGDPKDMGPQTVTKLSEEKDIVPSARPAAHTCGSNSDAVALQSHTEQTESCDSNPPSGPPPYSQTPLPQPPIAAAPAGTVATETLPVSENTAPSREGTPSRNTSRRLPRIPPVEAGADAARTVSPPLAPVALPNVPPQPPRRVPSRPGASSSKTRSATPQPVGSDSKPSTPVRRDTAPATPMSQAGDSGSRMSSIRSPPGGPAGPRTRGRLSRDTSSGSNRTQKALNTRQA